jgi:HEAT repeat protein
MMPDGAQADPEQAPDDAPDATARSTRLRRELAIAGHLGDASAPRDALSDPDPGVRATALKALHRQGVLDDETLAAACGDPAASVRRCAAELASRHRGDAPALLGLLDDPDPGVVEVAAFALGERDAATPVVRALALTATEHEDPLCRESAVAALGALGDPAGAPAVLAACHDRASVRRRAVLALAAFDGPEVDEALRRLSQDRDLQVRQAAEDLLAVE